MNISTDNVYKKSAYLYGLTEIKAHAELWIKASKKNQRRYRFRIVELIQAQKRLPKYKQPLRFNYSPEPLLILAGLVVDKFPLPEAFNWTGMDVVGWIDKLGFPQYRNTFHRNYINGHSLIFLDASALSAMNIQNFDHIKAITKAIRELYGMEMILFIRSISLPPRYPLTHFNLYHGNTGPTYHFTKRTEFFRKMNILRPLPKYEEHWQRLEKWLKHYRPIDVEKIGLTRRRNLYKSKTNRLSQPIKPTEKRQFEDLINIHLTEHELRKGYVLSYLCDRDSPFLENQKYYANEIDFSTCDCEMCCQCNWDPMEFEPAPRTLDILRKQLSRKYEVFESQYYDTNYRGSLNKKSHKIIAFN